MEQLFWALVTWVIGVAGCAGYFYVSNLLLDTVLPARGPDELPGAVERASARCERAFGSSDV